DIRGIPQTLDADEAELILIQGEAFFDEDLLSEIEEAVASAKACGKQVLLVGENCHGIGALLHLDVWCPYGR
ncbi:MAG: hypothetical protein MJ006_05775, partial [Methanocorpusculum sp.]|nr:hypothetical protein [Methanocorpusculum sp.]